MTDQATKDAIQCAADELAARDGCRFEPKYAAHAVDFFTQHLRLWEGPYAGQPFAPMPWQREVLQRLFGWVRWSEQYGRWVRRFRKAGIWAPKKNAKSPLGAGVGLYLFVADGEQGQKVFSAAKDGEQAKIVHAHAVAMVEAAPAILSECKINRSTLQITHLPTRSTYSILTGDNIKGQEGRNGSAILDEIHVVDERLASVLKYMGASRPQPLIFQISTAGDDPECYGRKQWEYGISVNEGRVPDSTFLHMAWTVPDEATDEQLATDRQLWQSSNPAWGITIEPQAFAAEVQEALQSPSDWATFKRYRFNRWINAASPWLKWDDWQACREEFSESDLEGHRCWLGLDLSKTNDMTACVAVFPCEQREGEYRQLAWFWLPSDCTRSGKNAASYQKWREAGALRLTEGNTIDYPAVLADVVEICGRFNVQSVLYDRQYADQFTQELNTQTGLDRVEFPQTMSGFAGPTAAYERLVMGRKLRHNGNPVLSWQAGHVTVKQDANANKRPVKPKAEDERKIDGIVAGIMALAAALANAESGSYYDQNEVEIG